MFANKLKMDSVAEAVKNIMSEEESGLRMAAHAAHRQGKKMFSFQGKTYPVKVQGEEVTYGEAFSEEADCVTEPKAKEIAKKEVHGHEKKMHKEEKEENTSAKMTAAYGKEDQEETPARKTIKAHGGPVPQPKIGLAKEEVEELDEREMTSGEKTERERLVKSMKKGFKGFRERYGKKAKNVMYATATKRAMGEEIEEEVEQIDELKKSTLGSYVKGAARDMSASRKIATDFEHRADRAKKPSMKDAASRLSDKFNAIARKRNKGIGQAVERLTKEETVEEGWDDMLKSVKDSAGPQPSGGSGVKLGTRYGGGKQKDKPEHEEDKKEDKKKVTEAKHPEDNSVPFEAPYNTSSSPAVKIDKSGAKHTPMSRAKHLAHLAMARVKKDLGQKGK